MYFSTVACTIGYMSEILQGTSRAEIINLCQFHRKRFLQFIILSDIKAYAHKNKYLTIINGLRNCPNGGQSSSLYNCPNGGLSTSLSLLEAGKKVGDDLLQLGVGLICKLAGLTDLFQQFLL